MGWGPSKQTAQEGLQQPWMITSLAQAHIACGSGGSEWEGPSCHVAVCPPELTEGCAGARDLPRTEATAKPGLHGGGLCPLVQMPMHVSPGDALCPFSCPGFWNMPSLQ